MTALPPNGKPLHFTTQITPSPEHPNDQPDTSAYLVEVALQGSPVYGERFTVKRGHGGGSGDHMRHQVRHAFAGRLAEVMGYDRDAVDTPPLPEDLLDDLVDADVWRNTLSYAATALETSADNGDRYCASQIRDHLDAVDADVVVDATPWDATPEDLDKAGQTFMVDLPCPSCGKHDRIMGYLLVTDEGAHQHTRYVCTAWPSHGDRCGWEGFTVPGWDKAEPTRDGIMGRVLDLVTPTPPRGPAWEAVPWQIGPDPAASRALDAVALELGGEDLTRYCPEGTGPRTLAAVERYAARVSEVIERTRMGGGRTEVPPADDGMVRLPVTVDMEDDRIDGTATLVGQTPTLTVGGTWDTTYGKGTIEAAHQETNGRLHLTLAVPVVAASRWLSVTGDADPTYGLGYKCDGVRTPPGDTRRVIGNVVIREVSILGAAPQAAR